jgi:uncharacterized protein YqhQ
MNINTTLETKIKEQDKNKKRKYSLLLILSVLLILFITFDLWIETAHSFLKQTFHDGKPISWKIYAFYAVIATIILFTYIYIVGVQNEFHI